MSQKFRPPAGAAVPRKANAQTGSRNLREGLRLLEWLSPRHGGAGVREAAAALHLTHSSAHRFLETMCLAGWVRQSAETGKYELGPSAVRVGLAALERMDLRGAARPALQDLAEQTGETAYLGILVGDQVTYIEIVAGGHPIGLHRPVGWRHWAHSTAVGKVLLADIPPNRLERVLPRRSLPRSGPQTIVSPATLRPELAAVRAAGVAVNDEESGPGVFGLAVPLRDGWGRVVAGLGIGGPRERMLPRRAEWEVLLRRHGDAISALLGYRARALPAALDRRARRRGG